MLRGTLFFSFLACALASPTVLIRDTGVTLPFVLHLNASGSRLPDLDRARAANFKTKSSSSSSSKKIRRQSSSIDVTNTVVTYVANVGVGSPPTNYSLLIDTGSSNTWVGATQPYVQTSTSVDTGNAVSVSYGSGDFSGEECASQQPT